MADVRVKIDAPAGVVELEGDRDFVSAYLDKLLPLVEQTGLGKSVGTRSDGEPPSEALKDENASPEAVKKKRRVTKPAPAGHSCRDRLNTLRTDGFFKELRTPSEIVTGLSRKGWTHNVNQVSAALGQMFKGGEISRTKNDNSVGFSYFWDRD